MLGVIKNVVKCFEVLVGLLLITINVYAQEPVWEWATNAGGTDYDDGNAIAVDSEGNCYVTGNFVEMATFGEHILVSSDEGDPDIYIAKVDINGNWVWAVRAGGIDWDSGSGIVLDSMGNIYVTGYFMMTADFGPYSLTSNGFDDAFVAKLDSEGNWLWVKQAGGTRYDGGTGITADESGNCYVSGCFENTAFFDAFSITTNGLKDGFVAKLSSFGIWQWAKNAGGSSWDYAHDIAIDNEGYVYVSGDFGGTAHFGSYSLTSLGSDDIFLAKINSNGIWLWASQAGGSSMDLGNAITIDDAGNNYITGMFENEAYFGLYYLQSSGSYDIFIAKIDPNGIWQWAKQIGGVDYDNGEGITIDNVGNSYITGGFEGIAYFGSDSLTSNGGRDIFVAKIDSTGMWEWTINSGGVLSDIGCNITINNENNCWVTGFFNGTSSFGSHFVTSNGCSDIFVAKLNPPVSTDPEINPDMFNLSHYPNPIKTRTIIHYSLKQDAPVSLEIYNLKGQLIETLLEGNIQSGDHTVEWDCQNVPAGVYFLKMKTNDGVSVKKLVLLK